MLRQTPKVSHLGPDEASNGGQEPNRNVRCWVCRSLSAAEWKERSVPRGLTSQDLRITDYHYGATLALLRCKECGFVFADGDDLGRLPELYEQLADPEYLDTQESRLLQMRWLLEEVLRAAGSPCTLLDIGAGAGLLVAEARRRGVKAVGVEPSVSLVQSAPEVNNVELIQGTFPHPQLRGHTFDVICLVDVIEHVTDPVGLLRECADSLTSNGIVMVVTPDVSSVAAGLMRKRWWHFRLAHVGYFNYRSMRRAADEAGLVVSRCFRAKWFFTIAYLAERLTRYLPLNRVNEFARRTPLLQKVYARVVPVNLRDSMVVFLKRRERPC